MIGTGHFVLLRIRAGGGHGVVDIAGIHVRLGHFVSVGDDLFRTRCKIECSFTQRHQTVAQFDAAHRYVAGILHRHGVSDLIANCSAFSLGSRLADRQAAILIFRGNRNHTRFNSCATIDGCFVPDFTGKDISFPYGVFRCENLAGIGRQGFNLPLITGQLITYCEIRSRHITNVGNSDLIGDCLIQSIFLTICGSGCDFLHDLQIVILYNRLNSAESRRCHIVLVGILAFRSYLVFDRTVDHIGFRHRIGVIDGLGAVGSQAERCVILAQGHQRICNSSGQVRVTGVLHRHGVGDRIAHINAAGLVRRLGHFQCGLHDLRREFPVDHSDKTGDLIPRLRVNGKLDLHRRSLVQRILFKFVQQDTPVSAEQVTKLFGMSVPVDGHLHGHLIRFDIRSDQRGEIFVVVRSGVIVSLGCIRLNVDLDRLAVFDVAVHSEVDIFRNTVPGVHVLEIPVEQVIFPMNRRI